MWHQKVLSFATTVKADACLVDCASTTEGSAVNAMIEGYNVHYAIGSLGNHLVQNSLAALLAATEASGKLEECAAALARYQPPKGRGVTQNVPLTQGGAFKLIDESYNASPASVRAAISVLSNIKPERSGRRILVLGDIRELGVTSPSLHAELVPTICEANIALVFACGEMMRYMYDALPTPLRGGYAPDSVSLVPLVAEILRADDVVTVKGSNSLKLSLIIDALKSPTTSVPHKVAISKVRHAFSSFISLRPRFYSVQSFSLHYIPHGLRNGNIASDLLYLWACDYPLAQSKTRRRSAHSP